MSVTRPVRNMRPWIGTILLLGLLLALGACQYSQPVTGSIQGTAEAFSSVAFVGFQTEPGFETPIRLADLAEMNNVVLDRLVKMNYQPIPPGQIKGTRAAILSTNDEVDSVAYFKKIGIARASETVLIGNLYRYREKMTKGDPPASIGLTLRLIRTVDGIVLWRGRYDETQKSIFENLLNISRIFKKGLKWATAKELALSGIDQLMDSFPSKNGKPEK
ncbi:MAG: hypothetical protein JRD68_12270 [Deltaproteobacteria bacterium]|nr:hypothetical protein [Deltaproteobacteria bacterium]